MQKLLIIVSILFLFSVNSALAQDWFGYEQSVTDFATNILGLPQEWLTLNSLIFNVVIPFLAIMAVSLGMLRQLRVFPRAPYIEILLAFLMAFSTLPTRAFVVFVGWSLGAMGMWSYILFFILFIVGSTLFAFMRGRGYVGEMQASMEFYKNVNGELEKIRQTRAAVLTTGPKMNADAFAKKMEALDMAELKWEEKLRAWREHH